MEEHERIFNQWLEDFKGDVQALQETESGIDANYLINLIDNEDDN